MKSIVSCALVAALGGVTLLGCGAGGTMSGRASGAGGPSRRGKAARAPSSSAQSAPPAAYAGTRRLPFAAAPLSAPQRSRLVKTGQVTVSVHVDSAGKVSAFGQAEFEGTIRKVAHAAAVQASGPGVVRLRMQLTPPTRRYLAAGPGRSILMYVGVSFSKSRTAQRLAVRLEG